MPRTLTDAQRTAFREKICTHAEALFAEHGLEAVTMRQLAAQLGVSAMTPYTYFRDRDDLLAAVRTRVFERFAAAMEAAATSNRDASGAAYAAFAVEQPGAYRLMFDVDQSADRDYPELDAAIARARRTLQDQVAALTRKAAAAGDPDLVGHVLWAMLHGTVTLQLGGKLSPKMDPDRLRRAAMAVVTCGLPALAGF